MMSCGAILFDCDGTLVDSERLVTEVIVEAAAGFGVVVDVEEALVQWKGTRLSSCVTHLESLRGEPLPSSFVPQVRKRMMEVLATRLRPVDGALDLVRSLSIPFGVASNGPREKTELSLSVTGLLPYFQGRIFSAYEVGAWKPDPALFVHAARSLGVAPQDCVVVEDSLPGVQAGLAAGMTVFALMDDASRSQLPAGVHVISRLMEVSELLAYRGA